MKEVSQQLVIANTHDTKRRLTLACRTEPAEQGEDAVCQLLLRTGHSSIGNAEVWTLCKLMAASIVDMLVRLERQPGEPDADSTAVAQDDRHALFASCFEAQWGNGTFSCPGKSRWHGLGPSSFYALPIGTEVFDGEAAYLFRLSAEAGRLIWRDFDTRQISEQIIDFADYLATWRKVGEQLLLPGRSNAVVPCARPGSRAGNSP